MRTTVLAYSLGSVSVFDLFVRAVEWAVLFFACVTLLLGVWLLFFRGYNAARAHHQAVLERRWGRVFNSIHQTAPRKFPAIAKRDRLSVLMIFGSVRERSELGQTLDVTARTLGLDVYARSLLTGKGDAERIVALGVLGWLGEASLIGSIRGLMLGSRATLSRTAAQALLRLDPASIDDVIVQVRDRFGYVRSRVELMFREAGSEHLDPGMQRVLANSDERGKLRLIDYLNCCSKGSARTTCLDILANAEDPELLAAALKALATVALPQDVELARRRADDPRVIVRIAALRLLKSTATARDAALLEHLTSDPNWWIRQRAAETLVSLDGGTAIAAEALLRREDPYACAAIVSAIASATERR